MSIYTMGDLAQYRMLSGRGATLRNQMNELTVEATTGLVANKTERLRGNYGPINGIETRIRQIDALCPEMLELVADPIGRGRIIVAPQDFVGVAEARGGIVHAADERIDRPIGVFDNAGLAMDEDVVAIARHDTDLHPP